MSRRRWLFVIGAITVALAVVLSVIDPATKDEGNPSIVDFEFAWDEEGAAEILADWGDEGQDAARLSLRLDFVYLAAYGAFLLLASAATRDLSRERGWRRMAAIGGPVVFFGPIGAGFDALEDVCLLIALDGNGGDLAPLLGGIFACFKFALTTAAILYILAGLVLRLRDRGLKNRGARI